MSMSRSGAPFSLDQYNSHEAMNTYLEEVAARCSMCSVITIGQSYEGRPMKVLKISKGGTGNLAIWIDAGIHAREWIAPATALNLIDKLSDESDEVAGRMRHWFDWYILPSANPDGYEFSRNSDRMWRKTRSPNPGSSCYGTDPNRNWDYHWMEQGASEYPCSDIYAGSQAFSEVETTAIRDFLLTFDGTAVGSTGQGILAAYISFHAYGQYWLTMWGYGAETVPDNYDELVRVGNAAVEAIRRVHGKTYDVGSAARLLYPAAGGSDDWAFAVAGALYSYTVELRDDGYWGFMLPEAQIQPVCEEIWAAMQELQKQLRNKIILRFPPDQ